MLTMEYGVECGSAVPYKADGAKPKRALASNNTSTSLPYNYSAVGETGHLTLYLICDINK